METANLTPCNKWPLFKLTHERVFKSKILCLLFTLGYLRFLSIRSQLTYVVLSLSFYLLNPAYAALSATTNQTIRGHGPTLSATHIAAINAGNDFPLLGVAFDGNDYFSSSDISSKLSSLGGVGLGSLSPIDLAKKLGDGVSGSMMSSYQIPLASDASDLDGDTFAMGSLTGSASVQWYYMNGSTETLLSAMDANKTFCQLAALTPPIEPYLKISGPVVLSTEYGNPNTQLYDIADSSSPISGGSDNPVHRIHPSTSAVTCYAKPNMANATGNFAGPSQKWDSLSGFIPQANIADNFPTTGANGLYFELITSGVDATTLTWSPVTSNNVTATPVATSSNTVKVTLTGPVASHFNSGATATSFSGPASFIIEGKNGSKTAVNYGFIIQKWFVNRGGKTEKPINLSTWCNGLAPGGSYKLISVNDVTNANNIPKGWTGGAAGQGDLYKRVVGGGLFAEWGNVSNYSGANFVSNYYWTINPSITAGENYTIKASSGAILSSYLAWNGDYGLCTQ